MCLIRSTGKRSALSFMLANPAPLPGSPSACGRSDPSTRCVRSRRAPSAEAVIGQRTKDALATLKARGVRLGRPVGLPDELRQRISTERTDGKTLAVIAASLNNEKVPTSQGGAKWHPSTVAAVLRSLKADALAA